MEDTHKKLCCFLLFVIVIAVECGRYPKVRVPDGLIKGYYKIANNGEQFSAFEGIPYAKAPVGKLRFEEPQPVTPWQGVWIANQTTKCLQYSHFGYATVGQEDCLFLNIYTPEKIKWDEPLDVIIYIHGGAFMYGDGHFWGPEILLENRVIYINLNYRLGPLGFLSTEDSVCPGNNGLKDQAMALKWIKDNIAHFGGNPNSITLTGLSAGGASVTYHYMSSWSQNLFSRAIALSGSALNPWALSENNLEKVKILARSIGCDDDSTTVQLIECLKTRPAHHIVGNVKKFLVYLYNPNSPFGPTIEVGSSNPFMAESPHQLMKTGKVQNIPIIFSVTQAEGMYPGGEFISNPKYLPEINRRWNELAPYILDYNFTVQKNKRNEVAQSIKKFYLKDKPISKETFIDFVKIMSDRLYVAPIEETVRLFANAIKSVYFQYFSYRGQFSFSQLLSHSDENFGVSHGDDTLYVLQSVKLPTAKPNDFKKMTEIMTKLWLTFAKTSVPKISGVDYYKPVEIVNGKFNYLDIQHPNKITMKTTNSLSNINFWKSLPFKENTNL